MSKNPFLGQVPDKSIFFDGVCVVCNGWVNFIIDRDKDAVFSFGALQSDFGRRLIEQCPELETDDYLSSVVLIEGGDIYFKSTAILRVMLRLTGWKTVARICLAIPRPIRDFFYNLFGRSRYAIFGKYDSCRLPTEEERDRFIG